MCKCVSKRTSVPLLPERKESYQPPPKKERQLCLFLFSYVKKSLSLPPLPLGEKGKLVALEEGRAMARPSWVCAGHKHCLRHPWDVQFRRQVREKAGAGGKSGGLIPLEGSSSSRRGSAAEGPVAEDALGKLLLSLLEAGPRPAIQGVYLGKRLW